MNLTISGHRLEVTPALRDYVTEKLDRATRHFDQITDARVILSVDNSTEKNLRQKAEATVHVKGGDVFAESTHEDLYAAVDDLVDKLNRQLMRHKDKLKGVEHVAAKHMM